MHSAAAPSAIQAVGSSSLPPGMTQEEAARLIAEGDAQTQPDQEK